MTVQMVENPGLNKLKLRCWSYNCSDKFITLLITVISWIICTQVGMVRSLHDLPKSNEGYHHSHKWTVCLEIQIFGYKRVKCMNCNQSLVWHLSVWLKSTLKSSTTASILQSCESINLPAHQELLEVQDGPKRLLSNGKYTHKQGAGFDNQAMWGVEHKIFWKKFDTQISMWKTLYRIIRHQNSLLQSSHFCLKWRCSDR